MHIHRGTTCISEYIPHVVLPHNQVIHILHTAIYTLHYMRISAMYVIQSPTHYRPFSSITKNIICADVSRAMTDTWARTLTYVGILHNFALDVLQKKELF